MRTQPVSMLFSSVFGALMAAAATPGAGTPVLIAAGLALAAVAAGVFFRPAAPAAVLLTVAALALGDPSPLLSAVSGLSAAAYLVIRYAVGGRVVTTTGPTVAAMVGFALAAVLAATIPLRVPWAPLVGPALVAVALIVLAYPLLGDETTGRIVVAPPDPGGPD